MELLIPAPSALAPRSLQFHPPLSDEELLRFCERNEFFRIERTREGVIEIMTPVVSGGGKGNANVSGQLFKWWEEHQRGEIFDSSTGFTLPDGSMLSPDASYVTAERYAEVPESEWERFARVCPNFVIEIMSKTDRLPRSKRKMIRWMENGVQLGWLLQPSKRRVFVYRSASAEPTEISGDFIDGTGPAEGFHLNLQEVWKRYRIHSFSSR